MNAVERVQQLAAKAHEGERHTWWLIRFPGEPEPIPVMFVPSRDQAQVLAFPGGRYLGCGAVPLLGME